MAKTLVFDALTKTYSFITTPQSPSTAQSDTYTAACQPTQQYIATYAQPYEMAQAPDLTSYSSSEGSTTSEDSYFAPFGWPFGEDEVGDSHRPTDTEGDVAMGATPQNNTGEVVTRSAERRSTSHVSSYILRDEEDDDDIYAQAWTTTSEGQTNDYCVMIGDDDDGIDDGEPDPMEEYIAQAAQRLSLSREKIYEEEEEEEPKPRTLTPEEVQATILARRKLAPRSIKERLERERAGFFMQQRLVRCSCTSFTNCIHDRGTLLCPNDRRVQRILNDAEAQRARREWESYRWH